MKQDDIENLAANHARRYGPQADLIVDEIIKRHMANAEWDEVKRWNRVKIRISRRQPTEPDIGPF